MSYKEAEVLVGRLIHVSYILPQLRCYLCSLYWMLKSWKRFNVKRKKPEDVVEDLNIWLHALVTFSPTRLIPNPAPTKIGWVGDASTSFGIGILIGQRWAQFQLRHPDERGEETRIAWIETVAIRLGLLMLRKLGIKQGKTFIIWTDNPTTESVIKKRKSKDKQVNEEWKRIQAELILLQVDVEGRRVKSKDNLADELSRGVLKEHKWRHLVAIDVPYDLDPYLFQVLF